MLSCPSTAAWMQVGDGTISEAYARELSRDRHRPTCGRCSGCLKSYHAAMKSCELPTYFRLRWPEPEVPKGYPSWLHYEIDKGNDSVRRSIEVFSDGRIERNSIEIEERDGKPCPSLTDVSLDVAFEHVRPLVMSEDEFESLWQQGVDTPFWNVR